MVEPTLAKSLFARGDHNERSFSRNDPRRIDIVRKHFCEHLCEPQLLFVLVDRDELAARIDEGEHRNNLIESALWLICHTRALRFGSASAAP